MCAAESFVLPVLSGVSPVMEWAVEFHEQAFEMQLQSDAEVQVDVQGVALAARHAEDRDRASLFEFDHNGFLG